jgi:hypothetical protein
MLRATLRAMLVSLSLLAVAGAAAACPVPAQRTGLPYFPLIGLNKAKQPIVVDQVTNIPELDLKIRKDDGNPPKGWAGPRLADFLARNENVVFARPRAFALTDFDPALPAKQLSYSWIGGAYRFEVIKSFKWPSGNRYVTLSSQNGPLLLPPSTDYSGYGFGSPICRWTISFSFLSGYLIGLNGSGRPTEIWAFEDGDAERAIVGVSAIDFDMEREREAFDAR